LPSPLLLIALGLVGLQVWSALSTLALSPLARVGGGCRGPRRGPGEVEFVVVTKAVPGVMDALREVLESLSRRFPGYRVWVVTDHDSPCLETLSLWRAELGFSLVVVPRAYGRGRYKSRAIQYFIDYYVDEDKWYVFLDDDSYPLDDGFLCEVSDDVPVYNGHIYPRRGASLLAWLVDGTRYYHSLTRQRLALGILHKPIYGLHGELLIARGWVLKRIPFASDSIVEDTLYAARLIRAGIPVGMVSTRVSILSPNSVVDLWRQRARWQLGVLRDMVRGLYPLPLAVARGADLALWLAAPISPLVWAYVISGLKAHPHSIRLLAALGLALYASFAASHGLVAAREEGPLRGLAKALLAAPILTLVHYLSPIYAAFNARRILGGFTIIDKSRAPPRLAPWRLGPAGPASPVPAVVEVLAGPPQATPLALQRGLGA